MSAYFSWIKEKPSRTYEPKRKCNKCGSLLSVYNGDMICHCHKVLDSPDGFADSMRKLRSGYFDDILADFDWIEENPACEDASDSTIYDAAFA